MQPATEVLVVVNSDLEIDTQLTSLHVQVKNKAGDSKSTSAERNLALVPQASKAAKATGPYKLPLSFSVVPPKNGDDSRFRIIVTGLLGDQEVVEQQEIVTFQPGKTTLLPVFLSVNCFERLCREERLAGQDVVCAALEGQCDAVPIAMKLATVDPKIRPAQLAQIGTSGAESKPLPKEGGIGAAGAAGMAAAGNAASVGGTGGLIDMGRAGNMSGGVGGMGETGGIGGTSETGGTGGNGCGIDVRTDAQNCGQCAHDCSKDPHVATATCNNGDCSYSCNSGWADCNRDPTNGCETPLTTLTNCGGCGVTCSIVNGTSTCATQSCAIASCSSGWADCDGGPTNGCETPLTTLTNCGGCRVTCSIVNGTSTCATQSCAIASCSSGWDDCDGDPANGCERNIKPPANGGLGPCLPDATGCTHQTNNGQDYYFCTTPRTWSDARMHCQQQLLGDLAHINDMAENVFLQSHAGNDTWIGGSDAAVEGTFRWSNDNSVFFMGGMNLGYAHWDSGQPDDNGGQDCVEMLASGLWDDVSCTSTHAFACELPSDLCPNDSNKTNPGQCGCGNADTDTDADGTPDCNDGCPQDPTRSATPCGLDYTPTNFDQTAINFGLTPSTNLNCQATTSIDTTGSVTISNWCGTLPVPIIQTQNGGPDVVILPLQGLTIASGTTLNVIGARPLILAVRGDVTINGTLSARGIGPTPGAGGNVFCGVGNGLNGSGDSNNSEGAGGGGGAGYGNGGGSGGAGNRGNGSTAGGGSGSSEGDIGLVPLRGGCRGGTGGNGSGTGGLGGGGGGAVQISALGSITIGSSGIVTASGGAGLGGSALRDGGGGGGSGGAILLEAHVVTVSSGAWMTANGGGGASGDPNTTGGSSAAGTDGSGNSLAQAPGGTVGNGAGDGGKGAASSNAAGNGGDGTAGGFFGITFGAGGGGGGGGEGRIRINSI